MFVAMVDVRLKPGADEGEFARMFADANADLCRCDGFVARRLLKSGDGSLRVVVEHDSRQTFEAMHQTDVHARWHKKLTSYMDGPPSPRFFNVVSHEG